MISWNKSEQHTMKPFFYAVTHFLEHNYFTLYTFTSYSPYFLLGKKTAGYVRIYFSKYVSKSFFL